MRVCFVVWRYPSFSKSDHAGGAEKQLQRLTTELNKRGHETTIISGKKGRNPLLEKPDENISVFRIPTTSLPGISMILYMIILPIIIVRLHFRERFDVIHIPLPDLFIISLYFTSRLLGIPVIARIAADELDQSYSQGLWATVRELIKSVILKVEGIQTLNPMAYNDALLLGKTREQVFLVPNGVNIPDKQKDYTKMSNKVLYIG
ncbi:MAG: glycosyltransferase family 4 protein, partial [Candidatus Thorarchaeota archaeon]